MFKASHKYLWLDHVTEQGRADSCLSGEPLNKKKCRKSRRALARSLSVVSFSSLAISLVTRIGDVNRGAVNLYFCSFVYVIYIDEVNTILK